MSNSFTVYPGKLKTNASSFDKAYSNLDRNIERIRALESEVKNNRSYYSVAANLRNVISEGENQVRSISNLRKALLDIISLYEKAENNIIGETGTIVPPEIEVEVESGSETEGIVKEENGASQRSGQATEEEEEGIGDYLWEALKQVVGGDFVDDSNLLGTVASIVLGFVPYVGLLADARDLAASIWELIDDGPETMEWVNLGLNLVAFIPGVGDFMKHSKKFAPVLKNVDEFVDSLGTIGEVTKGVIKKGNEVTSAIDDIVDKFNQVFDEKVMTKVIDKLDDMAGDAVDVKKVVGNITKTMNKQINRYEDTLGDLMKDVTNELTGYGDMVNEFIVDGIDFINEGVNSIFEKEKGIGDATICKGDISCLAVA